MVVEADVMVPVTSGHSQFRLPPAYLAPIPHFPAFTTLPLCSSLLADVADSLRGLEDGMKNLQQEFDFELEQQRLKAGMAGSGDGNAGGGAGSSSGGGGGTGSGTSPRAGRQAAFNSDLEAAAAAGGKQQRQQSDGQQPADGQQQQQADGQADLPPFAAVLRDFLATAKQRQAELAAASKQTSALVTETVAWLGEPASEAEQAAVFNLLFSFVAGFDHCAKHVHRRLTTGSAAGPAR